MCGFCCRKRAPEEVCKECYAQNDGCTEHCRDAFVYDTKTTDEEKIKRLRENYVEGGNPDGLTMGVKIPDHLKEILN